jgi:hypothetical protein
MRQVYIAPGIDAQKTHSAIDDDAVVHHHTADDKCGAYRHALYRNGRKVDEWGVLDGTRNTPHVQGQ